MRLAQDHVGIVIIDEIGRMEPTFLSFVQTSKQFCWSTGGGSYGARP
jgi:nucleoside-triphosphatase THEP1